MGSYTLTDNTGKVLSALEEQKAKILEKIGGKAETYAKKLCPVDTGNLRNSITHEVDGDAVRIGSGVEYAPYVELGTGGHYEAPPSWIQGGGTKGRGLDRWAYMDEFGQWHMGYPQPPRKFLQPAIEDHIDEYKQIIEDGLKNG